MTEQTRVAWDVDAYAKFSRTACFICEMLAGNPDYPHHVAYRDDDAVVVLSRFPWMLGHLFVAPTAHREHVVGDFSVDEYVHWHLVPLPPGVPYEEQQMAALAVERGYAVIDPGTMADVTERLRALLDG
jgi:diadenosine tetraphosphate (Ap4A) HIT family hydrolase